MKQLLILGLLLLASCGQDAQVVQGPQGPQGPIGPIGPAQPLPSPSPSPSPCPTSIRKIYPCGHKHKSDEVIFQLADGEFIGVVDSLFGGRMEVLAPGDYITEDLKLCLFTIHEDGTITW